MIPATITNEYLDDYFDHFEEYDHYLYKKYKSIILDTYEDKTEIDEDVISDINSTINALFFKNADKYDKIVALMAIEYDPLENYNGVEETKTTNGSRTDSNVIGSHTDTDVLGNTRTQIANGVKHDYNEDKVAGDNSINPQIRNRIDSHSDASTDTTTSDSVTNQYTKGSHTDTMTTGQQIIDVEYKRHGNLGVTTSQQMFKSEIDLRAWFNFYDIIFNDIIGAITIPAYE